MSFKATARDIRGITVVDVSGRITLGEGSAMLREMVKDMTGKGQVVDHAILANAVGPGCGVGCNVGRIAPADRD